MKQFRGFRHVIDDNIVELRSHSLHSMEHWTGILDTIIVNLDSHYKDNMIHVQLEQNEVNGYDSVLTVSYYCTYYKAVTRYTYVLNEDFSDFIIDGYVIPIMEHNSFL